MSMCAVLGSLLIIADVFIDTLLSAANPEGSSSAAQARRRGGGGSRGDDKFGGFGGYTAPAANTDKRDKYDDDRDQPQQQQQQIQQQSRQDRNSDRDDDRDQDANRKRDDGNGGNIRTQKPRPSSKPSSDPPKTVSEMIDRMLKPPLGSVPSDLFDVQIGGSMTNEILAVNSGPGLLDQAEQLGFAVRHTTPLGLLNLSIVRLVAPPGMSAKEARSLLERNTRGGHFMQNHVYRPYRPATGDNAEALPPDGSQSDSACAGRCYAHKIIRWHSGLQSCARATKIGFIDASVDVEHPSLAGRNIQIGDFRRSRQTAKVSQHGTSTLAVLAGGPGGTVTGLLPNSEYFAADIFFPDAQGEPVADTVALLQALEWMSAWGVRLINLSLAGPHDPLMQHAIEKLSHKGIMFIAAAGNDGPDGPPLYPAAYKDVIAVSAVAKDLRSYHRGNRGNYIDVSAPGVAIWTAVPGGEGYLSGTSFAVPYVTAIVAALAGQSKAKDKNALLAGLEYKDLGPPGRDPIFGRGLVLAPRTCNPGRVPPPVASVRAPPTAVRTGWSTESTQPTGGSAGLGATGSIHLQGQR